MVFVDAREDGTPRPRFKQRTWGTLRVVLSCDCAKASALDRSEFERFGIRHPGHPSCAALRYAVI